MPDSLQQLIQDTLTYAQDPPLLSAKTTYFSSASDRLLWPKGSQEQRLSLSPPKGLSLRSYTKERTPTALHIPRALPPTAPTQEATRPQAAAPHQPDIRPMPMCAAPDDDRLLLKMKQTLQSIAPHMRLLDAVLDDHPTKPTASSSQTPSPLTEVVLLACRADQETVDFLKNLAKAIDRHLGKTKIFFSEKMERQKRWGLLVQKKELRLIIASEGFRQFSELMHYYQTSTSTLGDIPFLPLSATAFYQAVEQKSSLWKTLCQMLKKPPS